jgi:CHAP domain
MPEKIKEALDYAKSMVGKTPSDADLRDYLKGTLDPRKHERCAAFLNATLRKAGISGTASQLAVSFLSWGRRVDPKDIRPGDVFISGRDKDNNPINPHHAQFGHVGIVESVDPATGEGKTISGDWSNAVKSTPLSQNYQGGDSSSMEYRRASPNYSSRKRILHVVHDVRVVVD